MIQYSKTSLISLRLHQLSWPTLQIRWKISPQGLFAIKYPYQFQFTILTCNKRYMTLYIILIISFFHHITYFSRAMEQLTHLLSRLTQSPMKNFQVICNYLLHTANSLILFFSLPLPAVLTAEYNR